MIPETFQHLNHERITPPGFIPHHRSQMCRQHVSPPPHVASWVISASDPVPEALCRAARRPAGVLAKHDRCALKACSSVSVCIIVPRDDIAKARQEIDTNVNISGGVCPFEL